jgi:hypothetical protein
MKKRGQVALEFLSTYGWAFMVILLMIGALAYFGVLNPDKFLPQRCNTGPEFTCTEFMVVNSGYLSFKVVNNVGQSIADVHVTSASWDKEDLDSCFVPQETISPGDIIEIICDFDEEKFPPIGNKIKFSVNLDYRPVTVSYYHPLYAEIYVTLQSSEDTILFFGCTNPTALNYDETATDDDGSCKYPPLVTSWSVNGISSEEELNFNVGEFLNFEFLITDDQQEGSFYFYFQGPFVMYGDYNTDVGTCYTFQENYQICFSSFSFACPTCDFILIIYNVQSPLTSGSYNYELGLYDFFDNNEGSEESLFNLILNFN